MVNFTGSFSGLYGREYSVSDSSFRVSQKEQKEKLKQKQYDDIYEHEQAHKSAAGSLGGNIVIENNAEGIPIGGHVDIKMPVLNKSNPDKTMKHADIVIKSAMAPKDPSTQDFKVAAEAQEIKSKAQDEKQKSLNRTTNDPLNTDMEIGKNLNLIA